MNWDPLQDWLATTPLLLIAAALFAGMCVAAGIGTLLNHKHRVRASAGEETEKPEGQEGYIVSAVLGLLALLLGFTFSLAVDRFETRRHLVVAEANAIGTAYLRTQLLPEPHRARMSQILAHYTDKRIALATTKPKHAEALLEANDQLVVDMWAGTAAAFDAIKTLDFSSGYLESINAVIDLDTSRKTARAARVPAEVFAVLFVYLFTTAGVLGYVLRGLRGRLSAGFLLALLTLSLLLIIDIDRPMSGGIMVRQKPMEDLRALMTQPTSAFDKWREAPST